MITIRDIHTRLKLLPESADVGKNYFLYIEKAENAINSGNPDKIMRMMENGINDTTNSILPDTMLDLYDALYEFGNEHNLVQYANLIVEKYIPKVRDAKETQTNLKRKLGRIKTAATTKANSNIEDITAAIQAAIDGAKNNLNANMGKLKDNVQKGLPKKKAKASKAKNEAFIAGYESMLEQSTRMIYCDRILDNYNRISKRFNIDRIIQENIYENGIDDTIAYICRLIETYDVPDKVKYNTALETVWYGFNKNYVSCESSTYTTLITDYYLAKGNNSRMCSMLLEASMVVKKDDYQGDLEVITEEEPEEDQTIKAESMAIQDKIRAYVVGYEGNYINLNEKADFNKIFNDFKASDEQNKENKLKWLIRHLYSKAPDDIVKGTPSILNYIRIVFVLGTFAINPVVGAIASIADIFVSLHKKRSECEQMLKCFKNEIETSKKKLKSTTDPEEKRRLKSYISELEKGYRKIDEYYESQLTDAEIDRKYDEDSKSVDTFKGIIIDEDDEEVAEFEGEFDESDLEGFDIDFDDMEFNEAFIYTIGVLAERYNRIPVKEFDQSMIEEIGHTNPTIYNEMVDIALRFPSIIDKEMLENAINIHLTEERKKTNVNESYIYSSARYNLATAKSKLEFSDVLPAATPKTLAEHASYLKSCINILEAMNDIKTACDYYHPLIEGSFTNSIKMASEKVKRTLTKLGDKEKQISKNIDVSANNTKKAMEKTLTTDNREAVIKGSVLPSASKTIKLGITTAGLALIDPVLAVIGALGYIGLSKKYKAKERQMVIDEIEIELKMCEKYIEIAESKNDMKALKKLLTIQRELERQRQRIKYNMKVKMGQKYFDSKNMPGDTTVND